MVSRQPPDHGPGGHGCRGLTVLDWRELVQFLNSINHRGHRVHRGNPLAPVYPVSSVSPVVHALKQCNPIQIATESAAVSPEATLPVIVASSSCALSLKTMSVASDTCDSVTMLCS